MILAARGLIKRWSGFTAVDAVDLSLAEGEFVSIVGRSGSGKSTLLGLMGALTRPSAGTVTLDGIDLWTMDENQRAAFRAFAIGYPSPQIAPSAQTPSQTNPPSAPPPKRPHPCRSASAP